MAAAVSFSRWFGSFFLRDKPSTQGNLTLPKKIDCGAIQSMLTHRVGFVHDRLSKSFEFQERAIHGTNQSARGPVGR